MNTLRFASIVAAVVLLCACAPKSPVELRQNAAAHTSITVERDIRSAYRSLRAGLDECAGSTAADLFEAEGTAWIKISGPGWTRGESVYLYYDLTAQGANTTTIDGYLAFDMGLWPRRFAHTRRWAMGETGCP